MFNETIMLGLRTNKGVKINKILKMNTEFVNLFNSKMEQNISLERTYKKNGFLKVCSNKRILTDQIISDFFIV